MLGDRHFTARLEQLERRAMRTTRHAEELKEEFTGLWGLSRAEQIRRVFRGDKPGGGPDLEEPTPVFDCNSVEIPLADLTWTLQTTTGPRSGTLAWNGDDQNPSWSWTRTDGPGWNIRSSICTTTEVLESLVLSCDGHEWKLQYNATAGRLHSFFPTDQLWRFFMPCINDGPCDLTLP